MFVLGSFMVDKDNKKVQYCTTSIINMHQEDFIWKNAQPRGVRYKITQGVHKLHWEILGEQMDVDIVTEIIKTVAGRD